MKYFLYSIYDLVAKEYGPVFQAKNLNVASRYIEDLIKNNPVKLDEYILHCIGDFDSETGTISSDGVCKYALSDLFSFPVELKEVNE